VSDRVKELLERERNLQARCAAQRAYIAEEVAAVEARFSRVDRMAGLAQSALLHPAMIVGGIVALLMIGKLRGMRLIGRLYVLTTAGRRLMHVVRVLQGSNVEPKQGGRL
jgi:hypothetical protein